MSLTRKQQGILDYISKYIEDHQYPPSVRDIAAHFDLASAGGVHKHLKNLCEKGYISLDPNVSRSIRVLKDVSGFAPTHGGAVVELPLLGSVAAGQPIEHFTEGETLALPESMVRRPDRSFVLRVRGNSMVEEAILDGDYVVVEKQEQADNGEMVIAMINFKEATLKRFYHEGKRIRLQPSNFEMEPIYVDPREVSIQGVVRAVWRSY
ncbi:MAG: repressor LexA [Candidatus Lambdaproteobacteria bacterium RIFOXYD1_FULL_56_27]|uniref:LexA repressor n=1 Tax=Candidatus Lambdaproteobacteria bacterium RIFOXYD2_FULL_56_26 TaxID=1817773 RepID=A0A1F6GQ10_9PROT|nr:MAG: repressor LexA [Candidatus Lambdaproteobacteria bacterium RIFOXYD2_FULL_56_26]OGH03817.1 MAG: repressor LexA [Candidatus Lambdaproteobacteria bacterium RIFOXYC1_FULL_56_13]OGH06216.1 MAG: repressor LexA [Candidatus Lambdaproteobacteria bacterium RIFOXYD1_FULL_56_27]